MRKETKSCVQGGLWLLALIAADQAAKLAAAGCLKGKESLHLIPGVFELCYLENRGAAFGIMRGGQALFFAAAILIFLCIVFSYRRIPCEKRYVPLRIACVMIAAGAMGNAVDRLVRHYVIDFLYFSLISFPVFNFADCYVSIGIALLILLLFTYYKEEPFDFLKPSGKKY